MLEEVEEVAVPGNKSCPPPYGRKSQGGLFNQQMGSHCWDWQVPEELVAKVLGFV